MCALIVQIKSIFFLRLKISFVLEGLFKIWVDLGKKCFSDEGNLSSDANFIESACKVIRGVTQKFWEAKNEKFFQVII
jgi:hypothetical protein